MARSWLTFDVVLVVGNRRCESREGHARCCEEDVLDLHCCGVRSKVRLERIEASKVVILRHVKVKERRRFNSKAGIHPSISFGVEEKELFDDLECTFACVFFVLGQH